MAELETDDYGVEALLECIGNMDDEEPDTPPPHLSVPDAEETPPKSGSVDAAALAGMSKGLILD